MDQRSAPALRNFCITAEPLEVYLLFRRFGSPETLKACRFVSELWVEAGGGRSDTQAVCERLARVPSTEHNHHTQLQADVKGQTFLTRGSV